MSIKDIWGIVGKGTTYIIQLAIPEVGGQTIEEDMGQLRYSGDILTYKPLIHEGLKESLYKHLGG